MELPFDARSDLPPLPPLSNTSCSANSFTAGNVVIEDAFERHSAAGLYVDLPIGIYVVRSENLVLLSELVSPRIEHAGVRLECRNR
jgi:hypothetical protein